MKKISAILAALIAVISCSQKPVAGTAVLTGDIIGNYTEFDVIASPLENRVDAIDVDVKEGHFEIAFDNVSEFLDVVATIDDDVFGARVSPGDTVRMTFSAREDGHFDLAYDGPGEFEGRIWTDWFNTYDNIFEYNIRPDRDPDISTGESLRKVALNDSLFRAKYDGQLTPYHIHRADLGRDFLVAVILEYEADDTGTDVLDNPDYVALVKDLDPNDPVTVGSGMLARWASYVKKDLGEDNITRDIGFLREYKHKITNETARRFLAQNSTFTLRSKPELFDEETFARYMEAEEAFYPGWQELVDVLTNAYTAYHATRPGSEMPDVEMTSVDGSKVLLSSLFGKVIYIDIWATWCGPCVRETPYMAALAERMKGREDILCISISTDEDYDDWQKSLAAGNPDWPQYNLRPEDCDSFEKSLNISGIPRFIIIGKDGRIYDANAIRPSNPDIDALLLEAASSTATVSE